MKAIWLKKQTEHAGLINKVCVYFSGYLIAMRKADILKAFYFLNDITCNGLKTIIGKADLQVMAN